MHCMFVAALFNLKVWKQPVSTGGWMDKEEMVYTCTQSIIQS